VVILVLTDPTLTLPNIAKLTDREREIAGLVIGGATYKDIALALGITRSTLGTHIASIADKTGLRNGQMAAHVLNLLEVAVDAYFAHFEDAEVQVGGPGADEARAGAGRLPAD
jgi:DNA-binding CsgD family transcriptional regulator